MNKKEKKKLKNMLKQNKIKINKIKDIMDKKINNIYIECENPIPPSEFSINTLIKKIEKRAKEWSMMGDEVIDKKTGIIKNFDKLFKDFIDFPSNVTYEDLVKIEKEKIKKLTEYLTKLKTSETDGEKNAVIYKMDGDEIYDEVSWMQKGFGKIGKFTKLLSKVVGGISSAAMAGTIMAGKKVFGGINIDKRYKCNDEIFFMNDIMKVSEAIKRILKINLETSKKIHGIKGDDKIKFKKFFENEDSFINMCKVLEKTNVLKKGIVTGQLSFITDEIVKGLAEIYKKKEGEEKKMKNKQKKRLAQYIQSRTKNDINNLINICEDAVVELENLND